MEKILYWIKKAIIFNWKHCSKFCPVCRYYEICKKDDVLG